MKFSIDTNLQTGMSELPLTTIHNATHFLIDRAEPPNQDYMIVSQAFYHLGIFTKSLDEYNNG